MNKRQLAFTLIELLVVIAIIGILSGLIVVSMNGITQKADIAKAQVFSNSLKNSLMINLISEWKFNGSGVSDGSALTSDYTKDLWGKNDFLITNSSYTAALSGYNCVEESCVQLNKGGVGYLYVESSSLNPGTGNLTVEGWSYPTDYTYPGTRFPVGNYTVSSSGVPCWGIDATYYSYGIAILFSDGTNRFDNVMALDSKYRPIDTINKWAHIAVVFDRMAGKAYVYVNGKKQSNSADISSVTGNVYNPSNRLQVGGVAGWLLYGRTDNIRIYNTVIPTSQIQERYYVGLNNLLANQAISYSEYQERLINVLANK